MGLEFNVSGIIPDLEEFERDLDDIDMERVRHRTSKRLAEAMFKMVQKAMRQSDKFESLHLNSRYSSHDGHDGPSISRRSAWSIQSTGTGSHSIRPIEAVEQRAHVLNYGHPGRITPTNEDYLKFYIDGVPTFRKSVEGPDPSNYWEKAIEMLQKSDKPERIMEDELEKEFDNL